MESSLEAENLPRFAGGITACAWTPYAFQMLKNLIYRVQKAKVKISFLVG